MAKKPAAAHDPAREEELVVTVVRFKGSGETARKGIHSPMRDTGLGNLDTRTSIDGGRLN
jgi:hypothetical protein